MFIHEDFLSHYFVVDRSMNPQAMRVHTENLSQIASYCENKTDCRRVLQLEYFGQAFNKDYCKQHPSTSCDNCLAKVSDFLPV